MLQSSLAFKKVVKVRVLLLNKLKDTGFWNLGEAMQMKKIFETWPCFVCYMFILLAFLSTFVLNFCF